MLPAGNVVAVHPIERLRYVARAEGAEPGLLVREAAMALASFCDDPSGLVTACRRLVDRHASSGPVWWLAARVLVAGDPAKEARLAAHEVAEDPTARTLAADLPADTTVVVLGWPDLAGDALLRRADLEVLVVDSGGYMRAFSDRLTSVGVAAHAVPEGGLAAAVVEAGLVLLECSALGPSGLLAPVGSRAAAAVAAHAGVPVWAVAGVGRVLPGRLWEALVERVGSEAGEPWDRYDEVVPGDLVSKVAGPTGLHDFAGAVRRADCPVTPELLKAV